LKLNSIKPKFFHFYLGIRQLWFEKFKESEDIIINRFRGTEYPEAHRSIFCLAPPGLHLWTPRPVE